MASVKSVGKSPGSVDRDEIRKAKRRFSSSQKSIDSKESVTTITPGKIKRMQNLRMWKPGQSGNPKGRRPGSLASKTIYERWLHTKATAAQRRRVEDEFDLRVVDTQGLTIFDIALMQQIRRATINGDTQALEAILDRYEGKVAARIEGGGEDSEPIVIKIIKQAIGKE